jgi:uncharacterized protein YjeT (DUF2065 family)
MDNQLGKYLILIGAVILVLGIFIYYMVKINKNYSAV